MIVHAKAKVNLALDVLGKRADGYHELKMIMQTVLLNDNVCVEKTTRAGIECSCNLPFLPKDTRNLAVLAARRMLDDFMLPGGVKIDIHKRIPVSAGLAGGSSDCAAVLLAMNKLYGLGLSLEALMSIGASMGADVPFCVVGNAAQRGVTYLAQGVGERLTQLHSCPCCAIVIAKPAFPLSTADVFAAFDNNAVTQRNAEIQRPEFGILYSALKAGDLSTLAKNMINVLEYANLKKYPQIYELKQFMMKLGAAGALMSGSGPSVFAVFTEKNMALAASQAIKQQFKLREVFVTGIDITRNSK
ncbi:MAG: 4-(cytidine 5'-diphospho)-2-C-methyl-D-erythritol kinase [Clostridiales bacterium]|jgi:4-diphosphocytidyl-2-C-methyl-D-erythritol kinase|nr:4-(cytidine 5'-diphospho)-2-C-methyl-D-erythritol kinase [Clostridiales bacterium]